MNSIWEHHRLGIVYGSPSALDENGRLYTPHAQGRLFDAIAERTGGASVCVPLTEQVQPNMTYRMQTDPEDVVALPPLLSTIHAQRHYFGSRKILRQFANSVDVLFIRLPFQLPRALFGLQTPKLLHVAGDPTEVVRISADYTGIKRFVAERFARDGHNAMQRLVREPHTRVASNGIDMWEKLHCREGRVVVSSCLYESEMVPKSNLDLQDPPRILFVGYLRPEKGVNVLLEAFDRVRAKQNLSLTIVGGSDRAMTGAEQEIVDRIKASPYRDDIHVKGMIPFGDELFELYRSHDMYVLPSHSEGTPRTVVEARAFGCPAVATNVGGIPTSVTDGKNGLLVPPNEPAALAKAMQRLLDDDTLRRRLAQTGIDQGPQYSLESFADQLVEELEHLVHEPKLQTTS